MPKQEGTTFAPLEPQREVFLAKRFDEAALKQPALRRLREKLLRLGGVALVAPPARDPDLDAVLAAGVAFEATNVKHVPGLDSQCHANVSRLWAEKSERLQIVTGYALSDDGLWRCHTWGLETDRVVETTEMRLLYFGVTLTTEGAARFAKANI